MAKMLTFTEFYDHLASGLGSQLGWYFEQYSVIEFTYETYESHPFRYPRAR